MAFQQIISSEVITGQAFTTIIFGAVSVYAASRCIYLLYFNPLSNFPGPRIAAVSNIWYAYHWLSGRYPWAIENVLRKYGDVVRIAPNELVFITPQATIDIYSPHKKNIELFIKTDFNNRGKDLGGIVWEEDPIRHREVFKKISPAFSKRTLRAMEPLIHKYMDYFVERMKELGAAPEGVGLSEWTNWLAMDMSADLSWSNEAHQMRDMKNSTNLDVLIGFNMFVTVIQVFKRFPLLGPFQFLFVPLAKLKSFAVVEERTRVGVKQRIDVRGNTEHIDFFEFCQPADSPLPKNKREFTHLGALAVQLNFASFGPISDWFYVTLYFLLEEPGYFKLLAEEIRNAFQRYQDITPDALNSLMYLQACLEESLRILPGNNTGLPRYSPGAMVDGQYIPKGVIVQTSIFAQARSPKYFHDALHYRPQRWLPPSHPLYDPEFAKDDLKGFFPFSVGVRACAGREMAWTQGRLFMAKVLWTFDVVKVPGQNVDLEGTLLHYGFFAKPEIRVRLVPVRGGRG